MIYLCCIYTYESVVAIIIIIIVLNVVIVTFIVITTTCYYAHMYVFAGSVCPLGEKVFSKKSACCGGGN